jgi:hypothetical protein
MTSDMSNKKIFVPIPLEVSKRCSKEDRLQRINTTGGTPACEDAVLKSLRWLKSQQQDDGSWGGGPSAAMTGLALLAYFGHCETNASTEFGESCQKGIVYLVNLGLKNDGKMASNYTANSWCYEHAIATYALGEASTFCNNPKAPIPYLKEITEKAGQYIIDHQADNGGWAYAYATTKGHTDTSVVGWQIQALRACSHTDIRYKGMSSCIKKGLEYLDTTQNGNGAFGYTGPPPADGKYAGLTGVGVLCHQMWNEGKKREVTKGLKYIKENVKFDWNTADSNLYAAYYESQAMMQSGGKDWEFYNDLIRDQLLANQNADGSWKQTVGKLHNDSPVFRTALCTLMLEVYYRFTSSNDRGASGSRIDIH